MKMQLADSKRETAIASLRQTLKKTIKRMIYSPTKFVLNAATSRGFVQFLIRQQPWFIADRRWECERLRHELESGFQAEINLLRHAMETEHLREKARQKFDLEERHRREMEAQRYELESLFLQEHEPHQHEFQAVHRKKFETCLRDTFSLSPLENAVYNEGERLIPERSHEEIETIRHKSSYRFFRQIIDSDLLRGKTSLPITILDIGSGCGHGTYDLSQISGVQVTGIDIGPECIEYAKAYYKAENIEYELIQDIFEYAKTMKPYDYIVSRHVFEHIPDAFSLVEKLQWRKRLLINVPFAEKPGNPFHLLLNIRNNSFPPVKEREFFYEDLAGRTYLSEPEGVFINSICCCYSNDRPDIAVDSGIAFPVRPWRSEGMHTVVREVYGKLVHSLNSF